MVGEGKEIKAIKRVRCFYFKPKFDFAKVKYPQSVRDIQLELAVIRLLSTGAEGNFPEISLAMPVDPQQGGRPGPVVGEMNEDRGQDALPFQRHSGCREFCIGGPLLVGQQTQRGLAECHAVRQVLQRMGKFGASLLELGPPCVQHALGNGVDSGSQYLRGRWGLIP